MRVRIATFNAENLDDGPDVEPPLAARIATLRPQLARLDADVLCLQEVNAQKTGPGPRTFAALDRVLAGTAYEGFARVTSTQPPSGRPSDRHNLAIVSRLPVIAHGQLFHDLVEPPQHRFVTAEPPAEAPTPVTWERPALWATLDGGAAGPLTVVNLHLRAPLAAAVPGGRIGPFAWAKVEAWAEGFFLAAVKRAGQAFEVRRFVDRLLAADPEARIAVCGDFNAEENATALRIVLGSLADTGNAALERRALVPLDDMLPEHRRFSVIHGGRRALLDHIVVSRGLLAYFQSVAAHNEALADELVAETSAGRSAESHHAPLVAEFALP